MKIIGVFRYYMDAPKNIHQFWEERLNIMLIKRQQKETNQERTRAREIIKGRKKKSIERKKEDDVTREAETRVIRKKVEKMEMHSRK